MADYTGYETIYDYCNVIEEGHHTITLANYVHLPVEVVRLKEDILIDAAYLTKIAFGEGTIDTEMLILIGDNNITIAPNTVLRPAVRKKGFVIYCKDTLKNNGTISMTARGASAIGEDVLLYKNEDDTYEYIPAIGGAGGPAAKMPNEGLISGLKSADGINRQTGGGASGGAMRGASYSYTVISGAGGAGTSYSGGAGGGAISARERNWTGYSGSSTGGSGGAGRYGSSTDGYGAGGGAGNPGGVGVNGANNGGDGTGGLLIIYADIYINNGVISADGVAGGASATRVPASGGASGGGSVNIFYNTMINPGIATANGGAAQGNGGCAGANGCVTLQQVNFLSRVENKNVTYYSLIHFMKQYTKQLLKNTGTTLLLEPYTENEILDIANEINGIQTITLMTNNTKTLEEAYINDVYKFIKPDILIDDTLIVFDREGENDND